MDFIAAFADHLVELRRADSTIETYVGVLRDADATLPMGLICATEDELRQWLRARKWTKATAQLRTVIFRVFFSWACDPRRSPRLDFNPAAYLPSVKVPRRYPRPAPTGELAEILRQAQQPYRRLFVLAAFAGARCIELAALDRAHVNEQITLLHGKGDTSRLVPTHPQIWAEVRDLPPGPVLRSPSTGGRKTRRQVAQTGNHALDRMGYGHITMHMLRHWFATEAYEASDEDLRAVQELLGHASPNTTQIYVQVNRRRMAAAVAGLPDITSG